LKGKSLSAVHCGAMGGEEAVSLTLEQPLPATQMDFCNTKCKAWKELCSSWLRVQAELLKGMPK